MIISLNQPATVRCQDGKCYPCTVLGMTTDYHNLLPMAYVKFDDRKPVDSSRKIVVNMLNINFGGQYESKDYSIE